MASDAMVAPAPKAAPSSAFARACAGFLVQGRGAGAGSNTATPRTKSATPRTKKPRPAKPAGAAKAAAKAAEGQSAQPSKGEAEGQDIEDEATAPSWEPLPAPRPRLLLGQYNKFAIAEDNRLRGEQAREEEALRLHQRDRALDAYRAERTSRVIASRSQQEITTRSVRDFRGKQAHVVSAAKAELELNRVKALRQQAAWLANGARTRETDAAQRRKVVESRARAEDVRRSAVVRVKHDAGERRVQARAMYDEDLEVRKKRFERIRQETQPSGPTMAAARDYFVNQKKEAAAEVHARKDICVHMHAYIQTCHAYAYIRTCV